MYVCMLRIIWKNDGMIFFFSYNRTDETQQRFHFVSCKKKKEFAAEPNHPDFIGKKEKKKKKKISWWRKSNPG